MSKLDRADVVILGIPYDDRNSRLRKGPGEIRKALERIEGYDKRLGKDVFDVLKTFDAGDLNVGTSYGHLEEVLRKKVEGLREEAGGALFLFLGGNHALSLVAARELRPKRILQLDAHPDLLSSYEGKKYCGATWAYWAAKEFGLEQRGVRVYCEEEEKNFKLLRKGLDGSLYLTLDIDVFDASLAWETHHPEYFGWDLAKFCEELENMDFDKLIAFDVVEVAPIVRGSPTALLAANALKEVLVKYALSLKC